MDLEGAGRLLRWSPHPVWISGGITTLDELRALKADRASGAVLGMAPYTGISPAERVAREFG